MVGIFLEYALMRTVMMSKLQVKYDVVKGEMLEFFRQKVRARVRIRCPFDVCKRSLSQPSASQRETRLLTNLMGSLLGTSALFIAFLLLKR